jgi:hypothetical protein
MAMAAATAFFVVVLVMAVTVAISVTIVTATAATTTHMSHKVLNFLGCSLAVFDNGTLEGQILASQRMVQVYLHLLFSNLYNVAIETPSLFVL